MSEPTAKLVAALIAAQRQFKPAFRSETNPFFKSKYVDLQGVYDCCQKALWDNGLTVVQTTRCREGGVYLITQLMHTSGEMQEGEYPLTPSKPNDPQTLGAAMTYARRYALMAILGIAAEDDDGETAAGRGARSSATTEPEPKPEAGPAAWPGDCPDHKKPFRVGVGGGYYCPTKVGNGWCKQHPVPRPGAETKLPDGMKEEAPDESVGF